MNHTDPAPARTGITAYGCDPDEADLFRRLAPRYGLIPTVTEAPVCAATAALAAGNRCVSVGHKTRVSDQTLLALSRAGVRYLSTRSIGADHLDSAYAESVGITVGTSPYRPDGVADYTVMLMGLRHAKSVFGRTDAHDYRLHPVRGRELRDLTVGVVGTGRIGTAVIERLRGFGCRVLAHDLRPGTAAPYAPLDELLRACDLVTLHTPLTAQTRHLLDHRRVALMKPGAWVVNTGRGALIETAALLAALEDGRLGGAALDVVEGEEGVFYADRGAAPASAGLLGRLQELPNVLISPHTAYHTERALAETVENSLLHCLDFERRRRHG